MPPLNKPNRAKNGHPRLFFLTGSHYKGINPENMSLAKNYGGSYNLIVKTIKLIYTNPTPPTQKFVLYRTGFL
jgi:hypothetical protein